MVLALRGPEPYNGLARDRLARGDSDETCAWDWPYRHYDGGIISTRCRQRRLVGGGRISIEAGAESERDGEDRRAAALVRHQRHHLHRAGDQLGRVRRLSTRPGRTARTSTATSVTTSRPRCSTRTSPGRATTSPTRLVLPKDPPTRPTQDGSGGTDSFQLHPTFWLGMVMCDDQGSPNPDGAALTGHPTMSRASRTATRNIFAARTRNSPRYFGLGPGQAYKEMQFYPPGWAPWPAGIGCTANAVVRRAEHRHVLREREHRAVQQHRVPEHGRPGAGELRVRHQERRRDGAGQPGAPRALHARPEARLPDEPGRQAHGAPVRHGQRAARGDQRPHHAHHRLDDGQHGQRVRQRGVRPERHASAR